MKLRINKIFIPVIFSAIPAFMMAQGATDVFKMSQQDLRGTARFMSMGGAFGALGGDLTVLGQNPGGIGIYRSSDLGFTLDIDAQSAKAGDQTTNQVKLNCNNVGYVGVMKLDSDVMPNINWGVSYSRPVSFNRHFSGRVNNIGSSLSDYVGGYTTAEGWSESDLGMGQSSYNAYYDSSAPWMSILAYNSYLINPNNGKFAGLSGNNTTGYAQYEMEENGGVDEFNLTWGGNISNIVYWGMGFGITSVDYKSYTYYGENLNNANIAEAKDSQFTGEMTAGNASYGIVNTLRTTGSGWNFKMGVIVKPINEFRIGLAFHTPTYYSLKDESSTYASAEFEALSSSANNYSVENETPYSEVWYKIRTPWRYIASAAAVLGGQGIISFDYERQAYDGIEYLSDNGVVDLDTKANIKSYYKGVDIFRIGAEYRVTPQFSVRAGYSYQTSPVKDNAYNGREEVFTASTQPSYTFDKSTQYITCGLGYRYKKFYADLAYVHKHKTGVYNAFSQGVGYDAPSATLTDNSNRIVLSLGVRF